MNKKSTSKTRPVVARKVEPVVVPDGFNAKQRALWIEIQLEKREPTPDLKKIARLARKLTAEDAVHIDQGFTPGGGSRSPSLGRWNTDDDPADLREAARRGIL